MAFNKVTYHGNTLIDLSNDTVTPDTLAKGVTAHAANGDLIVGEGNMGPAAHHVFSVDELPNDAADGSMATVTATAPGWVNKTWDGFNPDDGNQIWSDGTNTYFSYYDSQYVLNGEAWEPMSWFGMEYFSGQYIWTDGTDIYYSSYDEQYVLDKESHRWDPVEWSGYGGFSGEYVWTDGAHAYLSFGSLHFVLREGFAWEQKEWSGITEGFYARNIWTDGTNIYCTTTDYLSGGWDPTSIMNRTYVLVDGSWVRQTMSGNRIGDATYAWSDGTNVYYNDSTYSGVEMLISYVLKGDSWETKKWAGYTPYRGTSIWNHNGVTYCSEHDSNYVLGDVIETSVYLRTGDEWVNKGLI